MVNWKGSITERAEEAYYARKSTNLQTVIYGEAAKVRDSDSEVSDSDGSGSCVSDERSSASDRDDDEGISLFKVGETSCYEEMPPLASMRISISSFADCRCVA